MKRILAVAMFLTATAVSAQQPPAPSCADQLSQAEFNLGGVLQQKASLDVQVRELQKKVAELQKELDALKPKEKTDGPKK